MKGWKLSILETPKESRTFLIEINAAVAAKHLFFLLLPLSTFLPLSGLVVGAVEVQKQQQQQEQWRNHTFKHLVASVCLKFSGSSHHHHHHHYYYYYFFSIHLFARKLNGAPFSMCGLPNSLLIWLICTPRHHHFG